MRGEDVRVQKRKFKTVEKTISSQKQQFTVSIPITHELKYKPDVSMLKSKAVKYDNLMGSISRKRYGGTTLGNSMFGLAASMVPQAGMSGVATIAPMIVAGILANAGLDFKTDLLIESLPGRIAIGDFVVNNAADTIIMMRSSIKSNPRVYLSCDKGNKKGNKNLAKYISWYCKDSKRVKTYLLDVNCTDENTDDIANAIKHSLVQTFGIDNIPTIFGQCTDSGGGGTGKKLYAEIEKLGLTPLTCYLITSCALHNLQTALRNGVQLVLGEGGLDSELKGKHNAMQLLHGAYNLQNWHEHDELKDIYLYTRKCEGLDEKFIKLEEPILTRWWLVGACATSFLKCKSTWEKICNGIRQATDTKSAAYKVASATYTLIQEPVIISDVHLLVAIHKWFLFPHFKWCQLGDNAVGGTPSFSARNMLVRYFSMMDQVRSAENGKWESLADFEGFKASVNGLPDEEQGIQRLKVTHFLRILCASLKKHFGMWISSNLLFLSLFSEQKTATCIAKFLSGGVRDHEETYDSEAHGSQINLQKLRLFLEQQCTPDTIETIKNSQFWRANSIPIALLANGHDIWNVSATNSLSEFKKLYLYNYAALPTNSQFTERGVKESGYVSLGRRSEKNRSALAIARARIIPDAMAVGKELVKSDDGKNRLVQGKARTKVLINEARSHRRIIDTMRQNDDGHYNTHRLIVSNLTCDADQFKRERTDKKVSHYKVKERGNARPIRTETKRYDLTPLLCGKIQYAKLLKDSNVDQVRRECDARKLQYTLSTNWTSLIKLIKTHEGDDKFFKPLTEYSAFKWNETHYD